ncbi:FdtA/QdtA family cupin domain-containing protein [Patescibacteria group bacterium]|nr:FdtA/QdtA family cupin domain-containing protein [Patescibacteria group bacterium]MBU1703062.1 FdtA/QdtA family cupin domain-containing protein [Patescibacteria group bacterium]MBU1954155.1 FdtA/QdtA family cupin domain-containing protein [Patescibacteria group bacterium]
MEKIKRIKLPTHKDERGQLSVVEFDSYVDWVPKRIYYVTDVKMDRGGHAVRGEKKIYICVQGAITARLHDGVRWNQYMLHGPDDALIMNEMCWREFSNFSQGAVLLAISSTNYDKDKYIFDMDQFLRESKG